MLKRGSICIARDARSRPRVRRVPACLACMASVASGAAAQHWIREVARTQPDPLTAIAEVDIADDGVVLCSLSIHSPSPVSYPLVWRPDSGAAPLLNSNAENLAACMSADGAVVFALHPGQPGFVVSYMGGSSTNLPTLQGVPLATTRSGAEAFGYVPGAHRVPAIFDPLILSGPTLLGGSELAGHTRTDLSAHAPAADGSLVFGQADFIRDADGAPITRTQLWNRTIEPVIERLVPNPAGYACYRINAVSAGGDFCAASAWNPGGPHLPWFHRFPDFTLWPLPLIPGDVSGDALDISEPGTTLIGTVQTQTGEAGRVWCATPKLTVRSLDALLAARNVDVTGWSNLRLRHVSPDGRHLSGVGEHDGNAAIWAAFVGQTCCLADMNDDGSVDLADFFDFFNCFDADSPCADLDEDPEINLGDFFTFLNGFDAGC
jgi:hypothetical protein